MPARGADLLQLGLKHVGEKYHLGIQVPKDNDNWIGPWDCAEFASWIVFQVSEVLFGCFNDSGNPASADAYTGYWDRDATTIGHIIPLDEAARTPGAAVLRRPALGAPAQGGVIGGLHVVDLEGARVGHAVERDLIRGIIDAFGPGVEVGVAVGVRVGVGVAVRVEVGVGEGRCLLETLTFSETVRRSLFDAE